MTSAASSSPSRPSHQEVAAGLAELQGRWWHSVPVGHGLVTDGYKSAERLEAEWRALRLPDLTGKRVLDVGAWDGYFSFRAEEAGAAHVTALDHYIWSLDPSQLGAYSEQIRADGLKPRPYDEVPELWRPDELPGKRCFDFARWARSSAVVDRVGDLMNTDLVQLGSFHVVLYLGVLYHVKDPFGALERLARVTTELAVIETEAISVWPHTKQPLWMFVGDDSVNDDPTNWWMPTPAALRDACLAAGFDHVEISAAPAVTRPRTERSRLRRVEHAVRNTEAFRRTRELLKGGFDRYRVVARAHKR